MNTRTNLAYEDRLYGQADRAVSYPAYNPYTSSPNVRIKVSTKKTQRVAQRRAHTAGILRVLLVVAFAFLVLLRGVMITDQNASAEKKQAELEALVASNEKLQVEIDRALDLDKVETIARDELGMRRAEKYQTIYLNLEQTDYVEKTVKNKNASKAQAGEFLNSAVAYLD
ncbi:MAG: septum formation initiator family protein [Clostridia bacterium]|nr:septum formation initiator family protein [Clostridia bacterium]